jgi:hypothetical protein
MGLLDRLRSWLGAVLERGEPEADEGSEEDADPRLDPENVTEVRKEADDDPAAKLTDVRERLADEEDGDEANG